MKNRYLAPLIVLSFFGAHSANAGVIYNWVDVTVNKNVGPITGLIEFSYDYWDFGGSLSADMNSGIPRPIRLDEAPIMDFVFFVDTGPLRWDGINWVIEGCEIGFTCTSDYEEGESVILHGSGSIWGFFDLNFGPFLSGSISQAGDGFTQVSLTGDLLWTVTTVRSDGPNCSSNSGPDRDNPECQGSQGVWVLDRSTLPVPEPGTLALLGAGLIGMGFARRRNQA